MMAYVGSRWNIRVTNVKSDGLSCLAEIREYRTIVISVISLIIVITPIHPFTHLSIHHLIRHCVVNPSVVCVYLKV